MQAPAAWAIVAIGVLWAWFLGAPMSVVSRVIWHAFWHGRLCCMYLIFSSDTLSNVRYIFKEDLFLFLCQLVIVILEINSI